MILGGQCWNAAIKMLNTIPQQEREDLFSLFKKYVLKMYNDSITRWILTNWKVVDDQHLQLIKHIVHQAPFEIIPVLDLSIAVNFKDINRFISIAKGFIACPAGQTVLACLHTKTVV